MTVRIIYSRFYCLSIFHILCLLIIIIVGYLYFQRSIKSQRFGYIGIVLLLIGYFAVILSVTLTGRSAALAPIGPELIPFHSYYVVLKGGEQELLRRTRVVGAFPDGNSALMLVCARLRHVAGTQWGSKKYMNMKHLEAMEQDPIAG